MLKNDTLKNGTSRIGLYGSAPWVIYVPVLTYVSGRVHTLPDRLLLNSVLFRKLLRNNVNKN